METEIKNINDIDDSDNIDINGPDELEEVEVKKGRKVIPIADEVVKKVLKCRLKYHMGNDRIRDHIKEHLNPNFTTYRVKKILRLHSIV